VGIAYYSWKEGWTVVEIIYFTAVTATTIGYGDYSPTTANSQIFTIFYAMAGISLMYGSVSSALPDPLPLLLPPFPPHSVRSPDLSSSSAVFSDF
jgi:hypothetical protein